MWVLLMIIFSQPYHVATVDILGTYSEKMACISEQKRATEIGTIIKTSFGCIKIVGIKRIKKFHVKQKGEYMKIPSLRTVERVVNLVPVFKDLLPSISESELSLVETIKKLEDALHDKKADICTLREKMDNLNKTIKSMEKKEIRLQKKIKELENCHI